MGGRRNPQHPSIPWADAARHREAAASEECTVGVRTPAAAL